MGLKSCCSWSRTWPVMLPRGQVPLKGSKPQTALPSLEKTRLLIWLKWMELAAPVWRECYSSGERIPEGLILRCIVWANVRALEFTLYWTPWITALVKTTRKKGKLCNPVWKFWFGLTFLTGRAWRNMPFSRGGLKGARCKPLALFTACSLHLSV